MAGAICYDVAQNLPPQKRQVSDEVEYLVADGFVGPAQGLQRAVGGKHQRVL